ncbi:hypothetical protein [Flagellimonas meridianipacifica]|uniref:DUF5020 family protein n=1 Tax=Flagellimonas meridianipacifica TaxID=1080225 RepID=A0A2T0MB12_9FLAO|nr:hypothetical protein [Allomuricauda pacifica]PRX54602.1 hypothetical protein CLV81_3004 [Allomuricauda pacifica]
MKLKNVLGLFVFIAFTQKSFSQTTIESFFATEEMVVETWFFRPLTEDYKLSIFSLNDAVIDYETEDASLVSYTVLGYDLWKGFGPVVGGRFFDGRASTLAGVQWAKAGEQFLITTNFTTELRNDPLYEFFLLAQYRFPLNEKLGFFSQFQNSTNFNSQVHEFSFQRLRIGLSWKKYQFGLGTNTYQYGENWDFEIEPGLFIRLEF